MEPYKIIIGVLTARMYGSTLHPMDISTCTKSRNGAHVWEPLRRKSKHGNRFEKCAACGQIAQVNKRGLHFTTARVFTDVKSETGSFRTWKRRVDEMKAAGYEGGVRDYIDTSKIVPKGK